MTSERRKAGLAIFGLGRAGRIHLANILSLRKAHLRYIVEENLQHGQAVAREYMVNDDVKVISSKDADQVFNDSNVDGIVICTPTDLHENLVRRGLKSDKAVFCEKPIAGTKENVAACYADAEKYGQPLLCAFNRRFDPSISLMRQRLAEGAIGELQCIKTCSRDAPFPPKEYLRISGGIFHDCGVHDIDAICWTIGEYPVSVFTQAHAFHKEIADLNDVDQVIIVMKFPSGCIASIDLSRHAVYGYDQRMEIFGSNGMLEQQNKVPTSVVCHGVLGACKNPIEASFPQRYREAYELELEHFVNVILGIEKEILVKKEETLQVCRLASACEESYRTGKQIFMSSFENGANH
ncbi:inositol 2-dehydrogenase-like isoform X1 [Apostichopus japonicus]|uniref:inositol 2-dehydrogenase-like isoform X1 n=1 Tax=Stichopus japonicus TaxID=307972 RepID=UPI003AB2CF24